jgi:sigma-B regulation protein RsbU (phosphoserine phosphatase)
MDVTRHATFFDLSSMPWERRLAFVVETMREISRQTDPQAMVQAYSLRMRKIMPSDGFVSLSRRDLPAPQYRITRSSTWDRSVNPWQQRQQLPVFEWGLLGELLYGNEPVIIDDVPSRLSADEPAMQFLEGMGSLVAVPLFDQGVALNMVVLMRAAKGAFRREQLPEHVWMANLFGRATHNLVLSGDLKRAGDEVRRAYDAVDRELQSVAEIQRSLLPSTLPDIPTLDVAAHYQTSRRAGGDYYDFFPLPGPDGSSAIGAGRPWGILVADVSGHGTPAAVLMAVTHSIAHTLTGPPMPPSRLMTFINHHLTARYTTDSGHFVTAFYGVYDPVTRTLSYSTAGHNPPRLRRAGEDRVRGLGGHVSLPLGIDAGETYRDATERLGPGDVLVLYTDGITEARGPDGDMFGVERLDRVLLDPDNEGCASARDLLASVLSDLRRFTDGRPAGDDRTLLVLRVR